jgi:hypothetical protein
VKKLGMRLGNWLMSERGRALWQAPDCQHLKEKRDRALLAVLLACGLRSDGPESAARSEAGAERDDVTANTTANRGL